MNPPTRYRRPVQRYRFDRKNNVVLDERRLTAEFTNPAEFDYSRGDRIFEPRRSSPAREGFKSLRLIKRNAKTPAAIAARNAAVAFRVAEAARKASA